MQSKSTLLLGASGLLGSAVASHWKSAGLELHAPSSQLVDIRQFDQVDGAIEGANADLVINCAAESSLEEAARDPDRAYGINVLGPHNIALACARRNIPLAHFSTDYVFDGHRRQPYREMDATGSPPNLYGKGKQDAELLIRQSTPRHYILRVAALFGPGHRADFVDWILSKADPTQPLTIVADRRVSPSYTVDIAKQLFRLVSTPFYGTYHASSHGEASWFDLAQEALRLRDKNIAGVRPVADSALKSPVVRPRYTVLDNYNLRLRGLDEMRPWKEALAEYLGAS
jgi:dTDP-4-dehydrorhamnose reductase